MQKCIFLRLIRKRYKQAIQRSSKCFKNDCNIYFNNPHRKLFSVNRDRVRISSTNGLENEGRITQVNGKTKRRNPESGRCNTVTIHLFGASSMINL